MAHNEKSTAENGLIEEIALQIVSYLIVSKMKYE